MNNIINNNLEENAKKKYLKYKIKYFRLKNIIKEMHGHGIFKGYNPIKGTRNLFGRNISEETKKIKANAAENKKSEKERKGQLENEKKLYKENIEDFNKQSKENSKKFSKTTLKKHLEEKEEEIILNNVSHMDEIKLIGNNLKDIFKSEFEVYNYNDYMIKSYTNYKQLKEKVDTAKKPIIENLDQPTDVIKSKFIKLYTEYIKTKIPLEKKKENINRYSSKCNEKLKEYNKDKDSLQVKSESLVIIKPNELGCLTFEMLNTAPNHESFSNNKEYILQKQKK